MGKEEIIKFAKDWIWEQWTTDNSIGGFEIILSAITGFDKTYDGYEGQNEDLNKLVEKVGEYPNLNIRYYFDVLKDNRPWNLENIFKEAK